MPTFGPVTNNTADTDAVAESLVTEDEPATKYEDVPNGSVES